MSDLKKPVRSVGVILDGNRRWAQAHGMPSIEGHRKGVIALKKIFDEYPRLRQTYGLESIVLYAFSTENWNRSQEELGFLTGLFERELFDLIGSFAHERIPGKQIRMRIIGERERFSPRLQEIIRELEEKTSAYTGGDAYIALSYGGRREILNAVSSFVASGAKEATEEEFSKHLWTSGMPDPDIIVRTGGAKRLSNFLPWQSVYSELFFTDTLWPDFEVSELETIFQEFQSRERRRGK